MKVVYKYIHGSQLYGTSTPQSDTDYKGIFIPSAEEILMLNRKDSIEQGTSVNNKVKNTNEDVDFTLFSFQKYLKLLTEGEMNALEMFFAPTSIDGFYTSEFSRIKSFQKQLLTSKAWMFLGYCKQQASKYGLKADRYSELKNFFQCMENEQNSEIKNFFDCYRHTFNSKYIYLTKVEGDIFNHDYLDVCGKRFPLHIKVKEMNKPLKAMIDNYGNRLNQGAVDWKALSHAVRIGNQAKEYLSTGVITFPRPEAEYLIKIKLGEISYDLVSEEIENLLVEVKEAADKSTLRKEAEESITKKLITETHLSQITDFYTLTDEY